MLLVSHESSDICGHVVVPFLLLSPPLWDEGAVLPPCVEQSLHVATKTPYELLQADVG